MTDVYYDRINVIVTEYAKSYLEDPDKLLAFFEKNNSPVSVMNEFYRRMVATGEIEPIEKYEGKEGIWNQACKLNCDRYKRIAISKALYSLDKILNV